MEALEPRNAAYNLFGGWPSGDLTFSFLKEPTPEQYEDVVAAFGRWAEVAPLRFTETERDGLIRIDPDAGYLGPNVLGQAYFPGTGDLAGDINFRTVSYPVALHEIGHAIGIAHSDVPGAVMYFSISALDLQADDVAAVQALYGVGSGGVFPLRPEEPPTYTPFPGFAGEVISVPADVNGDGAADTVFLAQGAQGHLKAASGNGEVWSVLAFPGFYGRCELAAGGVTTAVAAGLPDAVHFKVYDGMAEVVSLLVPR